MPGAMLGSRGGVGRTSPSGSNSILVTIGQRRGVRGSGAKKAMLETSQYYISKCLTGLIKPALSK